MIYTTLIEHDLYNASSGKMLDICLPQNLSHLCSITKDFQGQTMCIDTSCDGGYDRFSKYDNIFELNSLAIALDTLDNLEKMALEQIAYRHNFSIKDTIDYIKNGGLQSFEYFYRHIEPENPNTLYVPVTYGIITYEL